MNLLPSRSAGLSKLQRLDSIWKISSPWVPGSVCYILIYLALSTTEHFPIESVESLWQSLGYRALTEEPVASLLANHIQPPGLNLVYAITYSLPNYALILQFIFFAAGLVPVILVPLALLAVGVKLNTARVTSVLLALTPTTVLFTFFPYNTTLVSCGTSIMVLGVCLCHRRLLLGTTLHATGTTMLFLLRPSFMWFIALAWLLFPHIRRRIPHASWRLLIVLPFLFIIGATQVHYLVQFGLPTTSSFGGENAVRGMWLGGAIDKNDLIRAAGKDPCLKEVSDAAAASAFFPLGPIASKFPACLAQYPVKSDSLIVHEDFKLGSNTQFNTEERLSVAQGWSRLAVKLILNNPRDFLFMPFGVDQRMSAFEAMMSPGHLYPGLFSYLTNADPLFSFIRPVGVVAPSLALGLMLLALPSQLKKGCHRDLTGSILLQLTVFLVLAAAPGLWFEYGENQRFLAEQYPALAVVAALSFTILKGGESTENPTLEHDPPHHQT